MWKRDHTNSVHLRGQNEDPGWVFLLNESEMSWLNHIFIERYYVSGGGSAVKNPSDNAGDSSSIPGWGRSSGEGNGNPLQYFCLENSMDRGAWHATVHGVDKSQKWLHSWTTIMCQVEYPGTAEPGGLPSIGLHRVGHNHRDLAAAAVCSVLMYTDK